METIICLTCAGGFERAPGRRGRKPRFCSDACYRENYLDAQSAASALQRTKESICGSKGCDEITPVGAVVCGPCRSLGSAKQRASENRILFDLERADIPPVPETCPILGIPLVRNVGKGRHGASDNSPSLDRIIPDLGYVKGNIRWLSYRANRIKNDATPEESWFVAIDQIRLTDPVRAAFLEELNTFAVNRRCRLQVRACQA